MSVVAGKRREGTLAALNGTRKLAVYTITVTANEKYFPKRYRWCFTGKLVDTALEIHELAVRANAVYVKEGDRTAARRRYDLQSEALEASYRLTALLNIAYELFHVETARIEYWTALIQDARKLLRGWRQADVTKFRKISGLAAEAERSPNTGNANNVRNVNTDGTLNNNNANNSNGAAPDCENCEMK